MVIHQFHTVVIVVYVWQVFIITTRHVFANVVIYLLHENHDVFLEDIKVRFVNPPFVLFHGFKEVRKVDHDSCEVFFFHDHVVFQVTHLLI